MEPSIAFFEKCGRAYTNHCKKICKTYGINQTEFDILMFFGNNPKYNCARDVVDVRKIKANLVSVNVDKLVNDGYLERKAVLNDRRKHQLALTCKGESLFKKGQEVQKQFVDSLFDSVSDSQKETFKEVIELIEENVERILD